MIQAGTLRFAGGDTGLRFEARTDAQAFTLDSGERAAGPSPVQALVAALAACEGMDVIGILRKQRQAVTGYEIEIRAERADTHPRRLVRVDLVHRVRGHGLREAAVAEAVRLSEVKYCSVRHSLDPGMPIHSRVEVSEG